MTKAEQKRDQRRHQILDAAKSVFAERGFHDASINEIIKSAGIARGTFYLYFSSKEAVFQSILDSAIEGLKGRIIGVDISPGAAPPNVQLHQNVTRVLEYVLADRALIQLVINYGFVPGSESSLGVDAFFGHVADLIETSLRYGMSIGLVQNCDASLAAAQILGSLRGGIQQLTNAQANLDISVVASQLVDFALYGVISRPKS